MQKKNYLKNNEINLYDLFKIFWKEKNLFLSITVVVTLLIYAFTFLEKKNFKTEIKLRDPPEQLFGVFKFALKDDATLNVEKFHKEFNMNMLSTDNLSSFIDNYKKNNDHEIFLRSKKKQESIYSKAGISVNANQTTRNIFFLTFPKEINGQHFLEKYVEFTKQKVIVKFKNEKLSTLKTRIEQLELLLKISRNFNHNKVSFSTPSSQAVEVIKEIYPEFILYSTEVNQIQIDFLKNLYEKLEKNEVDYEHILDKASNPMEMSYSIYFKFLVGLVFSFFLSIVFIIFKSI